jgi:hypothetical protein
LTDEDIMREIYNLADENLWKFVVQQNGKSVYLYQNAFKKIQIGMTPGPKPEPIYLTHFFVDIRDPGFFYHMLIGGHADGAVQGLYLYLKFVRKLGPQAIFQTMIDMLTSDKTNIEKSGIILESRVVSLNEKLSDPARPIKEPFKDILEIPEIKPAK